MAVSKRLRFEILRRDNHTCYYCGHKAPEVELTIDHVLPKALGGDDAATNLVAACTECNSGKTSVAPGSPLVAQVNADAARWSAAMQAAIAAASADHEAVDSYRSEFFTAWNSYSRPAPLDENWRQSIENFRARGLPIGLLADAVHRAMALPYIKADNKFKYVCGIAWNRIKEIEREARSLLGAASPAGAAGTDVDEVTVDAVVAVWRATWLQHTEGEPGMALLAEVREAAADLHYEQDVILNDLLNAAQEAAWRATTDLEEWLPLPVAESAALSFLRGVLHGGHEIPTDAKIYQDLACAVVFAEVTGYSEDSIGEAAHFAGRHLEPDLVPYLKTCDGYIAELGTGFVAKSLATSARLYTVAGDRFEKLKARALMLHENFLRAAAEREARGENSPWDTNEVPF